MRQMTGGWLEMARGTGRGRAEHLLRATQSTARRKKRKEERTHGGKKERKKEKGKKMQRFLQEICAKANPNRQEDAF